MEKIYQYIYSIKCSANLKRYILLFIEYSMFQQKKSKHTISAYTSDIKNCLDFISNHFGINIDVIDLEKITKNDFRSYLSFLQSKNLSNISIARKISAIKGFFIYLEEENIISNSYIKSIKLKKINTTIPRALSIESSFSAIDIASLLSNKDWVNFRNKAIVSLIYACGLRIDEALKLNMGDIPKNYDSVIKIKGKGNKERIVPILNNVLDNINEYIKNIPQTIIERYKAINSKFHTKKIPLFFGVHGERLSARVVQRLVEQIRIKLNLDHTLTPHAFRHSFATHLLKSGVNLRIIQELLGHTSLNATERYLKINMQDIKDTQTMYHPRGNKKFNANNF